MTEERASEIVSKVANEFDMVPYCVSVPDAFCIGKKVGQMIKQLEIELSKEIQTESEE